MSTSEAKAYKLGHLVFGHPSARPPNRDRDNFFEAVQLDQNKL
jgi:hypothetical protein